MFVKIYAATVCIICVMAIIALMFPYQILFILEKIKGLDSKQKEMLTKAQVAFDTQQYWVYTNIFWDEGVYNLIMNLPKGRLMYSSKGTLYFDYRDDLHPVEGDSGHLRLLLEKATEARFSTDPKLKSLHYHTKG